MMFRPTCKQSGKVCNQFLVCMLPFVECFRILDFDKILMCWMTGVLMRDIQNIKAEFTS